MREIKYRIWWDNEMRDVKMLNLISSIETATVATHEGGRCVSYKNNPVMQYTGLKDKNGVPIYEGDFLKTGNEEQVVVIWNEKWGRFERSPVWTDYDAPDDERIYGHAVVVIGNIYENPGLLKP